MHPSQVKVLRNGVWTTLEDCQLKKKQQEEKRVRENNTVKAVIADALKCGDIQFAMLNRQFLR